MHKKVIALALLLSVLLVSGLSWAEEAEETQPAVFAEEDLIFSGLDFRRADPDACLAVYGPALMDQQQVLPVYTVREITCEGAFLEFTEAADGTWTWVTLRVDGEDVPEGPRGLMLQDTLQSVQERFGISEDDDIIYYTEYNEDEVGQGFALRCSFEEGLLTEYLLYRL